MKYLLAATMSIVLGSAFAQAQDKPFDWGACKIEMAKYCKSAKGNEQIWACLQEHDKDLSATCDASHAKYEEMTGKKK
jgi:hypothetical protein